MAREMSGRVWLALTLLGIATAADLSKLVPKVGMHAVFPLDSA